MKRLLTYLAFLFLISISVNGQGVEASKIRRTTFAKLDSPVAGQVRYVTDGTAGSPCTGSGTGAYAYANGSTWVCTTQLQTGGTVTNVLGVTNETDSTGGATPAIGLVPVPIADNFVSGLTSTATAAGTTVLTVASKRAQVFTGSTTQTITLPVVTTLLQVGFSFDIQNDSSGALTINSSGGSLVQTMAAGTRATFTCKLLTGTTAASWNVTYVAGGGISGTPNTIPKINPTGDGVVDSQITDSGFAINVGSINSTLIHIGDETEGTAGAVIDIDNKIASIGAGTESLSFDGTAHTASLSAAGAINLDSKGGVTAIGDLNGFNNSTKITITDSTGQVVVNGALVVGDLLPIAPGSSNLGLASIPFSTLFIGGAANNSSQITGTFTGNRVATLPDATGTVQLVGAANTGAVLTCLSNNTVLSTATGQVFTSPGNDGTPLTVTSEGAVGWVVTRAGTIRNLYIRTGTTAKVNTPATAIMVRKNGADTALTIAAMTQTTTTNSSDLTHSFTVVAGDVITVSLTTTGVAGVSTSIASITFELD